VNSCSMCARGTDVARESGLGAQAWSTG